MIINKDFLIQGPKDSCDGDQLFWSNQLGWVSRDDASVFLPYDLPGYFPIETEGIVLLTGSHEEFIPLNELN
jgi:hypothetical protein